MEEYTGALWDFRDGKCFPKFKAALENSKAIRRSGWFSGGHAGKPLERRPGRVGARPDGRERGRETAPSVNRECGSAASRDKRNPRLYAARAWNSRRSRLGEDAAAKRRGRKPAQTDCGGNARRTGTGGVNPGTRHARPRILRGERAGSRFRHGAGCVREGDPGCGDARRIIRADGKTLLERALKCRMRSFWARSRSGIHLLTPPIPRKPGPVGERQMNRHVSGRRLSAPGRAGVLPPQSPTGRSERGKGGVISFLGIVCLFGTYETDPLSGESGWHGGKD